MAEDVTVFAAASLKNALDDVAAAYKAETGKTVADQLRRQLALAKQIEEARAGRHLLLRRPRLDGLPRGAEPDPKDTRQTLLGNEIVLVAPADSTATIDHRAGRRTSPACSAPTASSPWPMSTRCRPANTARRRWRSSASGPSVADRVVQADNVRAALAFVARGEAPLGIVYQTDANAEPEVKVVGTFPADSHPPILYPVAHDRRLDQSRRAGLLRLPALGRGRSRPIEKQGFTVVAPASS